MTGTSTSEFIIKPIWCNPLFRKGFTEYRVVRKTISKYNGGSTYNAYTRISEDVLLKTKCINEAVNFRDELVKRDIK